MKCKECKSCQKVIKKRWVQTEWVEYPAYECWGVKEPFEISDVNHECTEYPEKREMKLGCNVCDGDYHQWIQSYVFRLHYGDKVTADNIDTHFCPNCGRKLTDWGG